MQPNRINNIDYARGLVMIIMALDHTRDFLHTAAPASPTNLATTTPILFFTRLITHLCAPSFVFLAGSSAWLARQKRPAAQRGFLLRRGLLLVALEFTLINFALWTDIQFRTLIFEVIGAIGAGFILLSLLYKCSPRILAAIGLVIIFGHDLLSNIMIPGSLTIQLFLSLFFGPSLTPLGPTHVFLVAYPIIPWTGIMLTGFAAGRIFQQAPPLRKKYLLSIGLSTLFLFLLLRCANIYGDPVKWTTQKNNIYTLLSFLNISKYPPSLLFTLLTLGTLFCILRAFDGSDNKFTSILAVFGRTPLFYFVVHLYLLHIAMFAMTFLQGFATHDLAFGIFKSGRPEKGAGISLPFVYLSWIAVVILMYPLCRWYDRYKRTHPEKSWLKYF